MTNFFQNFDNLPFLSSGLNLVKKKVLLRVDYNVPISKGKVTNDYRILKSLPTLKFLLAQKTKIILLSHLGRPKTFADVTKMSLKPVFYHLKTLLPQIEIFFLANNFTSSTKKFIQKMPESSIVILENTRFQDLNTANKESNNDSQLASFWASLADVYVFDAFATAHRQHASTIGVLKYFSPSSVYLGFLMKEELKKFQIFLAKKNSPFTVIVGGGKPESKLPLLAKILPQTDHLIVCGALTYTFWKAKGYEIGNNPVALQYLNEVKNWLKIYSDKIFLSFDFATTKVFADLVPVFKDVANLAKDDLCLDAGPKTLNHIKKILNISKTVVWNGPPGVFEWNNFENGTRVIMKNLVSLDVKTKVILGGGDSVAAAKQFQIDYQQFNHVSTGGGAFLLLLATKKLPVIEAFQNFCY